MILDQLRIFVAVAERQHMTAAARALHVTQSAASAAVATLEERHGVRLFHRIGRGIALSEAGAVFLEEARAVLARAAAAENVLQELGSLKRGQLRVVASQTTAAYWMPRILAAFRETYPAIAVEMSIGNTAQAAARVHNGEADLGIVEGTVDDTVLVQAPVGEDRLQVVAALPFRRTRIDADWLRNARWVMREQGSGTRSTLDHHLRGLGVDPETLNIVLVLPSNESVRTATEAGAGIAALSSLVVTPGIEAGTLHAAPIDFGPRLFYSLRHRERYATRAAEAFLEQAAGMRVHPVGRRSRQ